MLWLAGEEEQITEVGTMNLFLHWKNEEGVEEIITAPLDGKVTHQCSLVLSSLCLESSLHCRLVSSQAPSWRE